jgi:hypothetical protein
MINVCDLTALGSRVSCARTPEVLCRRSDDTVAVPRWNRKEPTVITDPTIIRIGQAVQLSHQGEREAAHLLFAEIWDEIGGEQGDPLHRCTLAHAMADVQDDVREELLWDQRALAAADLLTDVRVAQAGVPLPVAGLYPSLHLNLSECYRCCRSPKFPRVARSSSPGSGLRLVGQRDVMGGSGRGTTAASAGMTTLMIASGRRQCGQRCWLPGVGTSSRDGVGTVTPETMSETTCEGWSR